MKKAVVLVLLLTTGLLLSLGFLHWSKRKIHVLLNELFQESCSGQLQISSLEYSLADFALLARNARLIVDKQTAISSDEIRASIDLKALFHKRISLTIVLNKPSVHGFGKESALFRFINHFGDKGPPTDKSGWTFTLNRLEAYHGKVSELIDGNKLLGSGVDLTLERDLNGDYLLIPSAEQISITRGTDDQENTLTIGQLDSRLLIKDDVVEFEKIRIALKKAWLNIEGLLDRTKSDKLDGSLSFRADGNSLGFPDTLSAQLAGQGTIAGKFSAPEVSGSIFLPKGETIAFSPKTHPSLSYKHLSADFEIDVDKGMPRISVSQLRASGDGHSVSLDSPLQFNKSNLSGRLQIHIASLDLGPIRLNDLRVYPEIRGEPSEPQLDVIGKISSLQISEFFSGPIEFSSAFKNDTLQTTLSGKNLSGGTINVQTELSLEQMNNPSIKSLTFRINDFPLPAVSNVKDFEKPTAPLLVNIAGELAGPCRWSALRGNANLEIAAVEDSQQNIFSGTATLEQGALDLSLSDSLNTAQLSLHTQFPAGQDNTLHLNLDGFNPERYLKAFKCSNVSAVLSYRFALTEPRLGYGSLNLSEIDLGCEPRRISIYEPQAFEINKGELSLTNLRLSNQEQNINISGSLSASGVLDLKLAGSFDAKLVLPFIPQIDNLGGLARTAIIIRYDDQEWQILGRTSLTNGLVSIETLGLNAEKISGDAIFTPKQVQIEEVRGRLNDGEAKLEGIVDLDNIKHSKAEFAFDRVEFAPERNSRAILSGQLNMSAEQNNEATIRGEILIEEAEFRRKIDAAQLLQTLAKSVFIQSNIHTEESTPDDSSALLTNLDLTINAPRKIYLISNWGSAELKASLKVQGSLAKPEIAGEMETLSGWFEVRGRRYAITSGRINFDPAEAEPTLSIFADADLRTPAGQMVKVIIEASGPITKPSTKFSSDFGYSENELLSLLASGEQTGQNLAGQAVSIGILSKDWEEKKPSSLLEHIRNYLHKLTQLHTLRLEPRYNDTTGTIEPKLIAGRKITDKVTASLEQFFGENETESELLVNYQLAQKSLIGVRASPASAHKESSVGIEASFSVFADDSDILALNVSGNDSIETSEILKKLKIGSRSSLPQSELSEITEELVKFYQKNGFRHPQISAECAQNNEICREVLLTIVEGARTTISDVTIGGDSIESIFPERPSFAEKVGEPASRWNQKNTSRELTRKLRDKNFLEVRVVGEYRETPISTEKELFLEVELGKQVSIEFDGNSYFTNERLLESANLEDREQPFSRNSLRILLLEIEDLYKKNGFRSVHTDYQIDQDPTSSEINYEIRIAEGPQFKTSEVLFRGNHSISAARLRELITEKNKSLAKRLFEPRYAVDQELLYQAQVLKDVYQKEGFTHVDVSYAVDIKEEQTVVSYTIQEGSREYISSIEVIGFPVDLPLPNRPQKPISITQANDYINDLENSLKRAGYFSPSLAPENLKDSDRLQIHIESGPRTKISRIVITGQDYTKQRAVLSNITLEEGDFWEAQEISRSKQQLYRLGLFSQIKLEPADGTLDQVEEVLLINVKERQLQSLTLGTGVDSADGIRLFLEGTDRQILSDGRSFSLRLDGFYDPQESTISRAVSSLRYTNPYAFSNRFRLSNEIRFLRLENDNLEYDTDRLSFLTYLDRRLGEKAELSFGHTIFVENLSDVSPDVVLNDLDKGTVRLSFISGNLVYTAYDDVLTPRKGYKLGISSKIASDLIGSEGSFVSVGGKAAFLFPTPFLKNLTFANNVNTAISWPFSNTEQIPITQRYYLGGANTIRGFRENSLGPRGILGGVIGGDLLLQNNFELRYRILERLSLRGFLDVGTVFLRDQGVSMDEMRESAGAGIRYSSPVGPIGFDLGFPLDERSGEPSVRFHFSIGAFF